MRVEPINNPEKHDVHMGAALRRTYSKCDIHGNTATFRDKWRGSFSAVYHYPKLVYRPVVDDYCLTGK
jgi:hypothetical protein